MGGAPAKILNVTTLGLSGAIMKSLTPKLGDAATPATPQPTTAIAPPPELAAPTAADPAAQAAAEEALKKAKKNKGRANTILNGTVGEDSTAKTLLGA
jgi:hypothetical protein